MAAPRLQKPLLVAVDTNVLLDLADGNEAVWGAVETVRRRLKGVQIVVPPTPTAISMPELRSEAQIDL